MKVHDPLPSQARPGRGLVLVAAKATTDALVVVLDWLTDPIEPFWAVVALMFDAAGVSVDGGPPGIR